MELTPEILKSKRAELSRNSMQFASTDSATTTINVNHVAADLIAINYSTILGNQPNSYGNYVALWQANSIPWNTTPLMTQKIDTNTQSGSMIFTGLSVTTLDYIIGYAVGPTLAGSNQQQHGNICSTAYIPAQKSPGNNTYPTTTPSLRIVFVDSNSVSVDYTLPANITPQSNGAWACIWRGGEASYADPALASINISGNAAQGSLAFNRISIGRGLTYTVGLFTSGWGGGSSPNNQKPMACSVTFTT